LTEYFGVSRQAYYKQLKANKQGNQDIEIIVDLVKSKRKKMHRLGCKKLHYTLQPELNQLGIKCGRDKFFRVLKQERLLVKKLKSYTVTTQSYHRFNKHPNLIMDTTINRPEQVWVSDITYIRTTQGFMYLSLITDAYSKQIMGYNLSNNMKTVSSKKALTMALRNRKYPDMPLIHHSDRGFQYCSPEYTDVLDDNNINISMTTKYDPYENAIAERVNGILKQEFILDYGNITKSEAKSIVNQSISIYNYERPHLSCQYLTPVQAHEFGNYELKKWSKKFPSKGYPLEGNEYYI